MKKINKFLNKREDLISMILGLGIVILVVMIIFNFIKQRQGNITVPGIATNVEQTPLTTPGKIENVVDNKKYYNVVAGDSLWKIAQEKLGDGNLWKQIASENNITNGRIIEVGQKIILPEITPTLVKSDTTVDGKGEVVVENYQVKMGDSLWKIAVAQFGDGFKWTQIWNLNKTVIRDPNRLDIGMMIKLR